MRIEQYDAIVLPAVMVHRIEAAAAEMRMSASEWTQNAILRALDTQDGAERAAYQETRTDIRTYRLNEAAELLGVTTKTMLKYIHEGKVAAQKIGRGWRVTAESLTQLMRGTRDNPPTVYQRRKGEPEK